MALESENKGIKTGQREISPLADVLMTEICFVHCVWCDASIHS